MTPGLSTDVPAGRRRYDKYADLRDELRTKRRSVKRSASDLMEQIRPGSRPLERCRLHEMEACVGIVVFLAV